MAATPPAAAAAGGAHSVFVYGSLMADEVVTAILKRVPASSPALLTNYHRFNVKDRIYPAILPVESKKVAGKLAVPCSLSSTTVVKAYGFSLLLHVTGFPDFSPQNIEVREFKLQVIMGISDAELIVLDAFEDFEYVRRRVQISLTDTSETMHADTYVWSDAEDPDLYGEWDFEEWKRLHMKDFLMMTLGFMDGLERPEPKTQDPGRDLPFMHEHEQPKSDTQVES